jgi:transposase
LTSLEIVRQFVAGLDVHKKTVVAAVITPQEREVRTFQTTTQGLLELLEWLEAKQVRHVAMESTGIYWRPVFNLLEQTDIEEVLVVNARHIKQVPGRKTDVKDAEWIAELLQHGLLRGSFVPKRQHRELRDLLRYRRTLIDQRADEVKRIQKVLEAANIKLAGVAADILGVSGRAMLEALIEGEQDAAALARMARGRLRNKHRQLEEALKGSVGPHQRSMLRHHLELIDFLDRKLAELDAEVAQQMRPFQAALDHLDEIYGLGQRTAQDILGEIGTDMSQFPSDRHISSWAKLSPGNNESGGRKRAGPTGKGGPIRHIMIQAALNVSRNPNSYYGTLYRRLCRRGNKERALVAVAHALLVAIYHMLREGTVHRDLGPNHFDERRREHSARNAVRHLQRLGYKVTLEEGPGQRPAA